MTKKWWILWRFLRIIILRRYNKNLKWIFKFTKWDIKRFFFKDFCLKRFKYSFIINSGTVVCNFSINKNNPRKQKKSFFQEVLHSSGLTEAKGESTIALDDLQFSADLQKKTRNNIHYNIYGILNWTPLITPYIWTRTVGVDILYITIRDEFRWSK